MLALEVLERDEERLRLLGRQAVLSETSYKSALPRDVSSSFLDVLPDHLKFSLAFAHLGTIATGSGPIRVVSNIQTA